MDLGRQIGQIHFVEFVVFLAQQSVHILVQLFPSPCFSLFEHHFYKKLSLYIHFPNVYLGLGFEFGLQRIIDFSFVCQQSRIYETSELKRKDFNLETLFNGILLSLWPVKFQRVFNSPLLIIVLRTYPRFSMFP